MASPSNWSFAVLGAVGAFFINAQTTIASTVLSDYSAVDCPIVLERFSACEQKDLLFYSKNGSIESAFIPQIQCHFENQVTLYAYKEDGQIHLDANGDQLHEFTTQESCESLSQAIASYEKVSRPSFSESESHPLSQQESILVVASQANCENWKMELADLVSIYKQEGRINSKLLCIPNSVLKTRNPAKIRQLIQKRENTQAGIILVGAEIPTFEIYYHTGYGGDWSAYGYGQTDLPYGDSGIRFWNEPLSKTSSSLRNKVYHDSGYMYETNSPTPYAYDIDTLVKSELASTGIYQQKKWVSRWMGDQRSLQKFIERRQSFRVSRPLRITVASGSEGVFWRPHEIETFERWLKDLVRWSNSPSETKVFSHADLEGITKNLDPQTDILVTTEHGQPEAVGNLHATEIAKATFLPPILNLDTCLGGAWGYATDPESSLIYKSLSATQPPLVILASGGIKWTRTIGEADNLSRVIFMDPDALGKSLGQRQIQTFAENWMYWRLSAGQWWNSNPPSFAHQLFHNFSLFGDGSIEM